MKNWHERPQEVANLLNPAFCARLIYECVRGCASEDDRPLPCALGFLVLPLVLHPSTRETMSGRTKHFQVWLNSNQQIKVGFASRTRSLVPYSREAITFLLQTGTLEITSPDASFVMGKGLRTIRRREPVSEDFNAAIQAAGVLGKWISRVDSTSTFYASLGVMP